MRRLLARPSTPRIRILLGGHGVVLVTILLGLVASQAGAGPLHLVVALLLAFQVVSGIRSYRGLRGLVVDVELPSRTGAGARDRALVRVTNPRRRLAARAVEVEALVSDGSILRVTPALVPVVAAGRALVVALDVVGVARGVGRVTEIRLSSTYPARLFRRTLRLPVDAEVLVAPAVVDVVVPPTRAAARGADDARGARDGDEEWRGVRAWREGDSPRRVHARTSARRGALVVREDASPAAEPWDVACDARGLEGALLERVLETAAGLLRCAVREGRTASLRLSGLPEPLPVRRPRDLSVALDALARLGPGRSDAPPPPPPRRVARAGARELLVGGAAASDAWRPLVARKDAR